MSATLSVNGRDLKPRSEDPHGGATSCTISVTSSSVSTFTYSMLSPFAHPSEEKVNRSTKYVFKSIVKEKCNVGPWPKGEIHVMGIPIPLVNAMTKECLRVIASALNIKSTYRTHIAHLRAGIVALAPASCAWSLVFAHKSLKTTKAAIRKPTTVPPTKPTSNDVPPSDSPSSTAEVKFPPSVLPKAMLEAVINGWMDDISKDMIEEAGCQVCGILRCRKDLVKVEEVKGKIDFSLLDESHHINESSVTRAERKHADDPIQPVTGPVLDTSCDSICNECLKALLKHKVPKMALAKGLWIGNVPDELRNLSFAEKLLISRVRTNRYVVRVSSGLYKLSANTIAFSIPTPKIYNELPPTRDELDEVLAFIFTAPTQPVEEELRKVPLLVSHK